MNKKYTLLLIAVFFISIGIFSQNVITDTSATVVSYWKKGDKKSFVLEKITEQKKKSGLAKDSASFRLDVQVVNETDSSYTLDWRYTILSLPGLSADDVPGIAVLCNNLHVVYTTDETGSFVTVNNFEEIQAFLNNSFDLVMKPGNFSTEVMGLMKEFKKTFTSRVAIENLALKDVQLFHTLYGVEYSSKKESAEAGLPNVFGGQPFPAIIGTQLMNVAKDKSSFSVETTMDVDKEATTKIILEFLNSAGKKMGKAEIKPDELPEISIKDSNRFVVDAKTGWMRKVQSVRLADTLGSYKKETTIITMK